MIDRLYFPLTKMFSSKSYYFKKIGLRPHLGALNYFNWYIPQKIILMPNEIRTQKNPDQHQQLVVLPYTLYEIVKWMFHYYR